MRIAGIKVLHCDAGWRTWSFVKIVTNTKIVGWSEVTDSHGSPSGIEGVVNDLSPLLIGANPLNIDEIYHLLYSRTRQSTGSIVQKAIGGIENALLDIKGKHYGVPVYDLYGGPIRTEIPLYWSHAGTSRVRAYQHVNTLPIKSLDDVPAFAQAVRDRGFRAIKTNIPVFDDKPHIYMPGFARSEGGPERNADNKILSHIYKWIQTLRQCLPREDIILDLNYNFNTEGYLKVAQAVEPFALAWLEIDTPDPKALNFIRKAVSTPICSGENLYGKEQYRPFFENQSMDIASIDILWNGVKRSQEIASLAELYQVNCTTHNHYSNLATFMSAQFCAMIPNLRIMEYDVDDVRWRDDLCNDAPYIVNDMMKIPTRPGWGANVNEMTLNEHPRKI
jgi:L-alanine-DL-glutamate epimerase-like enolase superfamily enzyme